VTPSLVRAGLATALDTIAGLRCYDYVPDGLVVPCAVIEPLEVTFHEASVPSGTQYYRAYVLVIVGRMSDRGASDKLDGYLANTGAGSVRVAIETDPTLGGACSTLMVSSALPRSVVVSGVDMTAYRFEVDIYG
jgi:hypothetical protein